MNMAAFLFILGRNRWLRLHLILLDLFIYQVEITDHGSI